MPGFLFSCMFYTVTVRQAEKKKNTEKTDIKRPKLYNCIESTGAESKARNLHATQTFISAYIDTKQNMEKKKMKKAREKKKRIIKVTVTPTVDFPFHNLSLYKSVFFSGFFLIFYFMIFFLFGK